MRHLCEEETKRERKVTVIRIATIANIMMTVIVMKSMAIITNIMMMKSMAIITNIVMMKSMAIITKIILISPTK
jgi:hypothetical protein